LVPVFPLELDATGQQDADRALTVGAGRHLEQLRLVVAVLAHGESTLAARLGQAVEHIRLAFAEPDGVHVHLVVRGDAFGTSGRSDSSLAGSFPIKAGGEPVGVLEIRDCEGPPAAPKYCLTPEDVEVGQAFAFCIGLAVQQAMGVELTAVPSHLVTPSPAAGPFSETVNTQAELSFQNALLATQLEASADGVLVVDPADKIITTNRILTEMWRLPKDVSESDEGVRVMSYVADQLVEPAQFLGRVEGLLAYPGETMLTEVELKDGRLLECHSAPLRGADMRHYGRLWTFRDVTARRRSEEELRQSEARFRMLVENAPEAIVVFDLEKEVFVQFNSKACALFGLTAQELGATSPIDVSPAFQPDGRASRDAATAYIGRAVAGEIARFEWVHIDARGRQIPCEVHLMRLAGVGAPLIRGSIVDISERKRAEAENARLEQQLLAAQKLESIGRLAGGVAHDFNNMLSVILGHTEFALEEIPPGHALRFDIEEIRVAAMRSSALTRQLLAFARKQTVAPRVVDLNDAVAETLRMLRRLIAEDVALRFHPGSELWPLCIDPSQLDQILTNLCVNARDAIAAAGWISVETANYTCAADEPPEHVACAPGDYVVLTVKDNGAGMDSDTLDHIFEPFFTTKTLGKGTGLGLATVYGIVQQNGGHVQVQSLPGEGATFRVFLPRHCAEVNPVHEPAPQVGASVGTETVLLVEDQPELLRLTARVLGSLGYTVLAAATPMDAIQQVKGHTGPIDLLLTDVIMPGMNGRLLAEVVSTLSPATKVLYMSGYTANVMEQRGIAGQGLALLEKPFSSGELAQKVRAVLDEGVPQTSPAAT
jgi:two-component system, cell cycle sensor histidine kinase and response regulator CckA